MDIGVILGSWADAAADEALLLLFFLIAGGSLLGAIKVKGVSLGPAAVLFFALFISALDPRLELPSELGILGLVLFAYAIGITSGPSFVNSLRQGGPILAVVLVAIGGAALVTIGLGRLFGIEGAVLSGVFAGSLTNTPALAASTQAWESDLPTVGYSVTYLFGVLGMLILAALALRTQRTQHARFTQPDDAKLPIADQMTIRVEHDDLPDLYVLSEQYGGELVFSRIMTGDTPDHPGAVSIATDDVVPKRGDILSVVGPSEDLHRLCADIGHPSTVALTLDRSTLDYRRIMVSNPDLVGQELSHYRLDRKFGAVVTRARRGDVDFVATDDFVLQLGDRVRVVAPRSHMDEVAAFFGDSEERLSGFSMVGLSLGMLLGIFVGLLSIPLPGGAQLSLGLAGGVLIVGLFLGNLQRTGRVVWSIPHNTATVMTQLGIAVFLAYAGSNSGAAFAEAMSSPLGLELLLVGALVTTFFGLAVVLGGKYVADFTSDKLAGVLAASQTQPAVLGFVTEKSHDRTDVNLGYALVYPLAMIAKVILAPLIGFF